MFAPLRSLFPLLLTFLCTLVSFSVRAQTPSVLADRLFSPDTDVSSQAYQTLLQTPVPEILPFLELRYDPALEPAQLIRLLEVATPICDATCLPYLATALRHDWRGVVIQACHAAQRLGRAELVPALIDLLTRHPDEEVRYAAVTALESLMTDERYDTLLTTIKVDTPDAAALRILRMMPSSRMKDLLPQAIFFAKNAYFSTSLLHAWIRAGQADRLFDALLATDASDLPQDELEQTLLALVRLAPYLTTQNNDRYARLRALPEWDDATIRQKSLILAAFEPPFPELMRLVQTHPTQFTSDMVAAILERLPSRAMVSLVELVQKAATLPNGFAPQNLTDFTHPTPATDVFVRRLAEAPEGLSLALQASYATDTVIVRHAVHALASYPPSPKVTDRLIALLGHHAVAEDAARAISSGPLETLILADATDDTIGARYYARWALARLTLNGQSPSQAAIDDAQSLLADPRRRHALPAMALLLAAQVPLHAITAPLNAATSTQRMHLFVSCRNRSVTPKMLQTALQGPAELRAQAYLCFIETPDLIDAFPFSTDQISNDIRSANTRLALRAIHVTYLRAQHRQPVSSDEKDTLLSRLYTNDERIVHNALLALRAMHALPPQNILMTLLNRATRTQSRALLADLTGMPNDNAPQTHESIYDATQQTRILNSAFDIINNASIATRFGFD